MWAPLKISSNAKPIEHSTLEWALNYHQSRAKWPIACIIIHGCRFIWNYLQTTWQITSNKGAVREWSDIFEIEFLYVRLSFERMSCKYVVERTSVVLFACLSICWLMFVLCERITWSVRPIPTDQTTEFPFATLLCSSEPNDGHIIKTFCQHLRCHQMYAMCWKCMRT